MADWVMVSSLGTLLNAAVVGAGLWYASRQLKYVRYSNELATMTKLAELYDSPPVKASRDFMHGPLAKLMEDATFRRELESTPMGERAEQIKPIANFYEDLGAYVVYNAISEDLALMLYGQTVVDAWALLTDAIMVVRRNRRTIWAEFEELSARAERLHKTKKHQAGSSRLRAAELDRWLIADQKPEAPPKAPGVPAGEQ